MIIYTLFVLLVAIFRLLRISQKMTGQIINLYETLYQIVSMNQSNKDNKGAVQLSFHPSCKEINELHLTFNRVAKTINLATQSIMDQQGDEKLAQALMSYSEAYHIFGEFDKDHKERGVCLANIGSIMY